MASNRGLVIVDYLMNSPHPTLEYCIGSDYCAFGRRDVDLNHPSHRIPAEIEPCERAERLVTPCESFPTTCRSRLPSSYKYRYSTLLYPSSSAVPHVKTSLNPFYGPRGIRVAISATSSLRPAVSPSRSLSRWEKISPTTSVTMTSESKPPCPPFTEETARIKVKAAQDAWNTR